MVLVVPLISGVEDIDEIINNVIEEGDYELLQYKDTGLFIIDFLDRDDQSNALGRMSLFTEDRDYKGQIVDYSIVKEKEKYLLAHDLKSADIAAFYNTAEELTEWEEILKGILLEKGIIEKDGKYKGVARKALISIHQDEDFLAYRETVVSHELQHGLDFTVPEHWLESRARWKRLDSVQKETFNRFLKCTGIYDTQDKDLVITEFRAFTHTVGDLDYGFYIDGCVAIGDLNAEDAEVLHELALGKGFWEDGKPCISCNLMKIVVVLVALLVVLLVIRYIMKRKS
jgi:hypothetical protein